MLKIETIWRELLFQSIEAKNRRFTQKELAQKFGFSTSTIFQALKAPRKMGAVRVTGRFFVLEDPKKLLYHWASVRNLGKQIIFKAKVDLPIMEIEGLVPPGAVFAGFAAARRILGEPPADYGEVHVYSDDLESIKKRLVFVKGRENLIVFKADPFLAQYGQITTLAQTFVDLWNLPSWQAKEFTQALEVKINGLLS